MQLLKKEVQKLRPLVPPMPVKLRVIGRDDERRMALKCLSKLVCLLDPLANKVRCILRGCRARERGIVRGLLVLRNVPSRDAVIFEA